MQQDMARFLGLAVLAIGILLSVSFRRISAVVLPLLIVLLSLVTTIVLMAAFDVPLKLPTMILPSFVLAVGVGGKGRGDLRRWGQRRRHALKTESPPHLPGDGVGSSDLGLSPPVMADPTIL